MPGTRVRATDLATLESESVDITDNYVLICDGAYYLHREQRFANGTSILTVKRRASVDAGAAPDSDLGAPGEAPTE